LSVLEKLKIKPDVMIVDGQGYAHPRRFGLACHLGVYLDRPVIGCAKTRLTGEYAEPGPNLGDFSLLRDGEEVIGAVLRTKAGTKPVFVSVGHKISLDTAITMVVNCLRGYRLPEPTRVADIIANPNN